MYSISNASNATNALNITTHTVHFLQQDSNGGRSREQTEGWKMCRKTKGLEDW